MSNTFEVATASLPPHPAPTITTDPTPFTPINFVTRFDTPLNVFALTPEFGVDDEPFTIRIRNATTTGFDATCFKPINEDRASPGVLHHLLCKVQR